MIKKNLKAAQDRKKIYADWSKLFKEFQVGEYVYLRVKPKKSSLRIGLCAKLAPQFCGFERIGPIAYWLVLPQMVKVHNVFHVSLLKKYVKDVDNVIEWYVLQVDPKG